MNSGAVMSSSVDYHQLSRHMANHQPSLDWSGEYHGNGYVFGKHRKSREMGLGFFARAPIVAAKSGQPRWV